MPAGLSLPGCGWLAGDDGVVGVIGRNIRHEWLLSSAMVFLLLLVANAMAGSASAPESGAVRVEVAPDSAVRAGASEDRKALLLRGKPDQPVHASLVFTLPTAIPDGGHWVLWMERNPVDSVRLSRGDWQSQERNFYAPHQTQGPMPVGFSFVLPPEWQGEIRVDMEVTSGMRTVLRPQVMAMATATMLERRGVVVSTMIYASLFTIGLLVLALYSAARDRTFLALFGCAAIALLTLAAANGHLYEVPGLRWLGGWSGNGVMALELLLCATGLQLLLEYSATRTHHPTMSRVLGWFVIALVVLAAVCMLGLQVLMPVMQGISTICWIACIALVLWSVVEAVRHGILMAWPLVVLTLVLIVSGVFRALVLAGEPLDFMWARIGYQVVIVAFLAMLAVGLISRISEYRDQRDRDQLARIDTELRMQREAARSDINAALQSNLRACSESDIEWTAFRLLIDHLAPLLKIANAHVVVRGYHGQDLDVTIPTARSAEAEASIQRRLLALKRHAANGIPMQQPITAPDAPGKVAMEALVPLPIRSPAWGMLLFERAGGDGFSTEELALAGEFARLAVTYIEQSLATAQLRRSAELDALTGTFNRRTVDQWMARSFGDAARDGQPWSVLFVDLDHFKSVNDKFGHACGDQCLREVAQMLHAALGEGDMLGRYGGEEFVAMLPGRGGAAARQLGEQLRTAVENLNLRWEGQIVPLTVSVGVATRLAGEDKPAQTIDRADKALYTAKRSGRNCVQVAPAVFS